MNEPKDYRIDQIYIHSLKHKCKLVYKKENSSIIVAGYDSLDGFPEGDIHTWNKLWIRLGPYE